MSDIVVVGSVTPTRRTADDGYISPRALRDGTLVTVPLYDALAMEGRIFTATMGSVTTPLTFLATAANRPDAWIRVPTSTTILPISVTVALEAFAGTVTEIDVRIADNDIGSGTSSAATAGPLTNRASSTAVTSACTARQLATADTTAETNPRTIWRKTIPTASAAGNDIAGSFTVTRDMMGYPVLYGPSTWEVFIAATTTQATGFVVMQWAELPSTFFQ